jgi:hypothetical protein
MACREGVRSNKQLLLTLGCASPACPAPDHRITLRPVLDNRT